MSIDNENDAMDAENPGTAGVATAPSLDDLDAAMAALIRAASPSESTQAQSSLEPTRSGPAMALVNSVSIMDEDDDDFFDDDEEEESQEAAPPAAQQRANAPAPIPFRTPQPQAQEQQPPQQPQYTPPQPQSQPMQNEYVQQQPQQPSYSTPQPAPQQEYVASQPQAQAEQPAPMAPQAAPQQQQQPQQQPQPLPQQASAPQTVPYQQPVAQQDPAAVQNQAPQSSVPQHARATLMHETNQDKHLHDASKYISTWLAQNTNDDEVIEAAMDWARKHKTAEHNGNVIASLLVLENVDNEVTVMAVRWLTHHSMHNLAPQIVSGLTRRQQQ